MSLLLDALKKAAKDKEAANAPGSGDAQAGSTHSAIESQAEDIAPGARSEPEVDSGDLEFTLDPPALSIEEAARPTTNTISDEALQVLIYKTNHEHKRRRRLIWGGAFLASIIVLVVSGMYFFRQMQTEVEALELRHKINMQSVQSEPVKAVGAHYQTSADQAVSQAPARVERAEQKQAAVTRPRTVQNKAAVSVADARPPAAKQITIVRGEQRDPISTLLNSAWAAYNNADYARAGGLYDQVLTREKNNRDALMGMGAIALKNGDEPSALHYYNRLLQLDPRDATANAAIINMKTVNADSLSESKLQYLLRQSPDSAHLQYALGNKYAAQARWPEAQAAYFAAFENDSRNADYAFNLAVSLDRIGKTSDAARYYSSALELAQNSNNSFSIEAAQKRLNQIQP